MAEGAQSSEVTLLYRRLSTATNDRSRLALLHALSAELLLSAPVAALRRAEEALEVARELNKPLDVAVSLVHIGQCYEVLGDPVRALEEWRKGLALFDDSGEYHDRLELYIRIAGLLTREERYQEAVETYQETLDLAAQQNERQDSVVALKGLGDLYSQLADYHKALDHYLQALQIAEETENDELLGVLLSDVAVIYAELGDREKSLSHFERSLEIFRTDGLRHLEVRALSNLANVYAENGRPDEALEQGIKATAIYEALGDRNGLATTLVNLARTYEILGQLDSAVECCRKALDLFEELDDREGECIALIHTGALYQATGHHHHALYVLEQALDYAIRHDSLNDQCRCHHLLSRSYEEIGNVGKALHHLRIHTDLHEQLSREEQRRGIIEMQARFDLERAEKERAIYRLKNEQLELENRHKTAELTSLSMRLVEKNQFINDVKLAVAEIEREAGEGVRPMARELLKRIRQNVTSSDDWQVFEDQFKAVHHDFIQALSRRYRNLTPTELKICTLIRAGLSSSEIASLLHVTKRNVDTHRYRLRKKLEIDTDVDLGVFLSGL